MKNNIIYFNIIIIISSFLYLFPIIHILSIDLNLFSCFSFITLIFPEKPLLRNLLDIFCKSTFLFKLRKDK